MLSLTTQILRDNFESDYIITYTLVDPDDISEGDADAEEEPEVIETRDS